MGEEKWPGGKSLTKMYSCEFNRSRMTRLFAQSCLTNVRFCRNFDIRHTIKNGTLYVADCNGKGQSNNYRFLRAACKSMGAQAASGALALQSDCGIVKIPRRDRISAITAG